MLLHFCQKVIYMANEHGTMHVGIYSRVHQVVQNMLVHTEMHNVRHIICYEECRV